MHHTDAHCHSHALCIVCDEGYLFHEARVYHICLTFLIGNVTFQGKVELLGTTQERVVPVARRCRERSIRRIAFLFWAFQFRK